VNSSPRMGMTSSNASVDRIAVPATDIGSEIAEESRRSKWKRVPQQLADALNGCLCGLVLDSSLSGVLKCKQAGCET